MPDPKLYIDEGHQYVKGYVRGTGGGGEGREGREGGEGSFLLVPVATGAVLFCITISVPSLGRLCLDLLDKSPLLIFTLPVWFPSLVIPLYFL